MRTVALIAALCCFSVGFAATPDAQVAAKGQPNAGSPDDGALSEVLVTGTRIKRDGYETPTPVTVMTQESLLERAPSTIPDALNQLPQFQNSQSPQSRQRVTINSQVNVGNFLNLRGLGPQRSLILFDGLRVPPTSADGQVSIDTLPQALIQRVDIVTGGASAVYGSDAVVGVVNFVLDRNFRGLKADAQYGIAGSSDAHSYKVSLTGGDVYLDGRLHVLASAERNSMSGIDALNARPLAAAGLNYCEVGTGTATNPFKLLSGCHSQIATYGGLIPNSAAGSAVAALRGQEFLPNGTLAPFTAGGVGGVGGDGAVLSPNQDLEAPLATWQTFGRVAFDVNENLHVFAQGAWSRAVNGRYDHGGTVLTAGSSQGLIIQSGNAFLDPSVQALLGPTSTFQLGRWSDDGAAQAIGKDDFPLPSTEQISTNTLLTGGIEGTFGAGWKYDASYTHGRSYFTSSTHEVNMLELFAAVDAVRDPSNQIVCRVTLTNPGLYPGCTPFNPFGLGAPSAAALNYVYADSNWNVLNEMHIASASVSGEPFHTWAGPVSVAFGGEYRKQSLTQRSNADPAVPIDKTGLRGLPPAVLRFNVTNVGSASGDVNVKEGFMETVVPLARGLPALRQLDLNGAFRYTDYSTSGGVKTWKVGLEYLPVADLRLRATRSRDIRAPSLSDLFSGAQQTLRVTSDPHTGASQPLLTLASGNRNLTPEIGDTTTYGFVYQPGWLDGFGLSVDAYHIKISDAIASIDAITALSACEASGGTGPTCALISRPLPFSDTSSANYPTSFRSTPINVAVIKQRGVDFELSYRFPVNKLIARGPGNLEFRGLSSYLADLLTDLGTGTPGSKQQGAGYLTHPKWTGSVSVAYRTDWLNVFLQERFTGSYSLSTYYDVLANHPAQYYADHGEAPNVTYTDLTVSLHELPAVPGAEFFLTVNNLFDRQAPLLMPSASNSVNLWYPTIRTSYDVMGRYFTVGVRCKL